MLVASVEVAVVVSHSDRDLGVFGYYNFDQISRLVKTNKNNT